MGIGWTLFCATVALAEPTIGMALDKIRAMGIKLSTVLLTGKGGVLVGKG